MTAAIARSGATGLLAVCLLWTALAGAADAALAEFFGRWQGEALAESWLDEPGRVSARDLDVAISPHGAGGFTLDWTTIMSSFGEQRSTQRIFQPSGRPGIWRAEGTADLLETDGYVWARLRERTLTVYSIAITEEGGYELQVYERTLVDDGMVLEFTRFNDREVTRMARGHLVKVAD